LLSVLLCQDELQALPIFAKKSKLKSWPLSRHPYLVFYVERPDHIDVWRVLNAHRDIPGWMREAAGT
jgi:hypothetical protein